MQQIYTINICTVLISLFLMLVPLKVEAAVFGDLENMEILVKLQKDVIEAINPYISDVPDSKKSAIQKYINLNQKENSVAMENVTLFLANPVNCYIIIKRLTRDLKYVEDILKQHTNYKRNQSLLLLPNETDFQAACEQIVLLIYVYDMSVDEFSKGTFSRNCRKNAEMFTAVSLPMTSNDCYEVALQAYQLKRYQTAHDWFTETLDKYYKECQDGSCPFTEENIVQILKNKQHISLVRCDYLIDEYQVMQEIKKEMDPLAKYEHPAEEQNDKILKLWPYLIHHYCQKEMRPRNRLHCQYRYGPHPFLRLARFKTETLHLKPDITMYYDVISDEENDILKNIAEREIKTSNGTYERGIEGYLSQRHVVYIKDQVSRVAAKVSRRSLDISGLSDTMAERVKIANYGPAGYHGSHVDTAVSLSGSNTYHVYTMTAQATIMYYLSEPNLGGATTFLKIDLSVFPIKNSALRWKTMTPSGNEDTKTLHASCPILHGSKWIAVKWLSRPDVLEETKHLRDFNPSVKFTPLSYETLKRLKNI